MGDYLIDEIAEFTALTKNALKEIGVCRASQLMLLTTGDLNRIPLIGRKGKNAIMDFFMHNCMTFSTNSYFIDSVDADLEMGIQKAMYLIVTATDLGHIRV